MNAAQGNATDSPQEQSQLPGFGEATTGEWLGCAVQVSDPNRLGESTRQDGYVLPAGGKVLTDRTAEDQERRKLMGLSLLQRQILFMAMETIVHYPNREHSTDYTHLLIEHVFVCVYGWPRRCWQGKRDAIGSAQYDSKHAAVSRALRRMEQRGLIRRSARGFLFSARLTLTQKGLQLARFRSAHGLDPDTNEARGLYRDVMDMQDQRDRETAAYWKARGRG